MSRRAALLTQADIARVIRAAKQEGVREIEVRVGEAAIIMRLGSSSTGANSAPGSEEIVL